MRAACTPRPFLLCAVQGWPALLLMVYSRNDSNRDAFVSYALVPLPNTPGVHKITARTWFAVEGNNALGRRFFGGWQACDWPVRCMCAARRHMREWCCDAAAMCGMAACRGTATGRQWQAERSAVPSMYGARACVCICPSCISGRAAHAPRPHHLGQCMGANVLLPTPT